MISKAEPSIVSEISKKFTEQDDVEIITSTRYDTKKGGDTVVIKWGYKDLIKEKIVVAISRVDATRETHWVVPTLIQRI